VIRIVTDTDSNLPQDVVDEYGITLVPIQIIFGDKVLRERIDLTDAESYRMMSAAKELPKTSQPPIGAFKTAYEDILAGEPDAQILSIHISNKLSGTIASARQAADLLPDADITLFDTLSASLGQGLMVVRAAEMARQGADVAAILKTLEAMRERMEVFFVLNTLEYLAKGGRIGKASHLVGQLLDIKPILVLEDGEIDAHSRHRTWRRAVDALCELIMASAEGAESIHIGVLHAVSEEPARALAGELAEALKPATLILGEVGPGLGVHTGPGALGLCWITDV
jgi:DegV family protein with EDD domain